jgi:hypothetical protein
LVARLQADNSQYIKSLDQATSKLLKFSSDQNAIFSDIAQKIAAVFTVDKLVEFSASTIEAAASMSHFSESTGIAVESLSGLQFAAAASGVGSDALQTSLKKLNVSIADAASSASSKAALAFNAMGVSIKNADGSTKDAGTVIDSVADKFANYGDGANKVALATDLFGKAGENLIPLLNKGSSGIDALKDSAAAAGAVLSGPTAAAAEEFSNKMLLLKTTLVDGVGVQLESRLLPLLNDLGTEALAASKDVGGLDQAAEVLGTGLKLLVTSGIAVKSVFVEIGDAIGGAAAAISAAAHGNFSQAMSILDDQSAQAKLRQSADASAIVDTWEAGTTAIVAANVDAAAKIKQQAPAVIDLSKYIDELKAFSTGLGDEAAKLSQGTIAATNYKLQHGELATALKMTGAAGQVFADSALASARAIETANLSKEVADINASLSEFSGDTVTAGILKQAASTQVLTQRLTDLGGAVGAEGIAAVQAAQANNTYLLQFQALSTQAARVQGDLSAAEAATNAQLASGAITSLAAMQALDAERANAARLLGAIAGQQTVIADNAKNPALVQQAQAATAAFTTLASQTDTLTKQIRGNLEDSMVQPLLDVETGAKGVKAAFSDMVKSLEKDLLTIANKNIAESIFGTGGAAGGAAGGLASLFSGGGGGGLGALASLLGGGGSSIASTGAAATGTDLNDLASTIGGFAGGGTISAGHVGVVGENGPELAYSGARDMQIVPGGAFGGKQMSVTNHFTIQAPGGTISRQSQMQTAAAAARSLSQANRRNNT